MNFMIFFLRTLLAPLQGPGPAHIAGNRPLIFAAQSTLSAVNMQTQKLTYLTPSQARGIPYFLIQFRLMLKVAHTGKGHGDTILITCSDYLIISDRPTGLDDVFCPHLMRRIDTIREGKKASDTKTQSPITA